MPVIDYSLERFPDGIVDRFEWSDAEQIEFGVLGPETENSAHQLNVMIAEWIERLALKQHGQHELFMPDHTYVCLHDIEMIDDVAAEKHEVGFFAEPTDNMLFTPDPTVTLFSWRTSQQGFGVLWSCFGFRCLPISEQRAEEIYQLVIASAARDAV